MTDSEVHNIILTELKEVRTDIRDLRKDLQGFKIRVIGLFATITVAINGLTLYFGGK